jgi:hypothetical protein
MSTCLNLKSSACTSKSSSSSSSSSVQNNDDLEFTDAKIRTETDTSSQNNNDLCKSYKEAVELNLHLNITVKELEDLMRNHANVTLQRSMDLPEVNNTYSQFPVNRTISYKKFLKDIYVSYESGFYAEQIKRLKALLDTRKFPENLKEKCNSTTEQFEYFEIVGQSKKCLSAQVDQPIKQITCNAEKSSLWQFESKNEGKDLQILNQLGRYLNSRKGNTKPNYNLDASKLFDVVVDSGVYTLVSKFTGECIEETNDKCQYKTSTCDKKNKNQQFFLRGHMPTNSLSKNNENTVFLENKNSIMSKVNLSKMKIMTLKELHQAYSLLLEKSKLLI